MKKIIKADGIITNIRKQYKNVPLNPKNPTFAYISYCVNNQRKTSANIIQVRFNAKNGDHMQIYFVEGKPERVFKYPFTAWLFG